MVIDNPFAVNAYLSPQLFCDREREAAAITSALRNGRHVLLYSPRRYGKTGLIHHVFNGLARVRGARTVFADVYAARDGTHSEKLNVETPKSLHDWRIEPNWRGILEQSSAPIS